MSKTENAGKKSGVVSQKENESDTKDGIEVKVTSLRAAVRLIEMCY